MRKRRFLLIVIIVGLILMMGSWIGSRFQTDRDLIGTETCHPPCWNMIIPGNTIAAQAIEILKVKESNREGNLTVFSDDLQWSGDKDYHLHIWEGVINEITFDVDSVSVEEIIKRFGEPEGIGPGEFGHDSYSIILYYPTRGLVFVAGGKYDSRLNYTITIFPNMPVSIVSFVAPGDFSGVIANMYGQEWVERVLPTIRKWDGYGAIGP